IASYFFFSSRRRHTRFKCDWSSDVCSSDLRIIGEGRERAHLQQLIDGFGIADRVRLLGSLCDDEMVAEIGAADVFVMPSVTNAEIGRASCRESVESGVTRCALSET